MGLIVHINGYPGIGKLTIARHLADRISARLLDNHTLLNPSNALFARDDPRHGRLRRVVRHAVFSAIADMPADTRIVTTDALSDEAEQRAIFNEVRDLALHRGDRFVPVVLETSLDENMRRVAHPSRAAHRKITDPELLRQLRSAARVYTAPDAKILDITALEPEQAADQLAILIGADQVGR